MKSVLIALFFSVCGFSQTAVLGSFYTVANNKTHEVKASLKNNDKLVFDIKIETPNRPFTDRIHLVIKEKRLESFKEFLKTSINVFEKWKTKAKQNNISDVTKPIKTKTVRAFTFFSYANTIYLDYSVWPIAEFIIQNNYPVLKIRSTYRISYDANQLISTAPLQIIFSNTEEVNTLIELLNIDLAYDKLLQKQNKLDIFD